MLWKVLFWILFAVDALILFVFVLLGMAFAKPSHTSVISVLAFMVIPTALLGGVGLLFLRAKGNGIRLAALAVVAMPILLPALTSLAGVLLQDYFEQPGGRTNYFFTGELRRLQDAIYRNDAAAIAAAPRIDVNQFGRIEMTLLALAVRQMEHGPGSTGVVQALLRAGADPNLESGAELPLSLALRISSKAGPETVHVLLDGGADPNARSGFGTPAFFIATGIQIDPELLRLLLDRGADINAQDNNGATAITHATQARNWKAVLLLLQRGADASKIPSQPGMTFVQWLERESSLNRNDPALAELIRHLKSA